MNLMESKKLQLELIKMQAARAELEFKIFEREQDIQRIEEHIKVQDQKIAEIEEKLSQD